MSVKDFELWRKVKHQTVDSGELQVCQPEAVQTHTCVCLHVLVCVCMRLGEGLRALGEMWSVVQPRRLFGTASLSSF